MPIPKLPAFLVAALGVLGFALTLAGPSLASPWREVAAALVALLAAGGVPATVRAVRRHGEASAHNAITRYTTGRR